MRVRVRNAEADRDFTSKLRFNSSEAHRDFQNMRRQPQQLPVL